MSKPKRSRVVIEQARTAEASYRSRPSRSEIFVARHRRPVRRVLLRTAKLLASAALIGGTIVWVLDETALPGGDAYNLYLLVALIVIGVPLLLSLLTAKDWRSGGLDEPALVVDAKGIDVAGGAPIPSAEVTGVRVVAEGARWRVVVDHADGKTPVLDDLSQQEAQEVVTEVKRCLAE